MGPGMDLREKGGKRKVKGKGKGGAGYGTQEWDVDSKFCNLRLPVDSALRNMIHLNFFRDVYIAEFALFFSILGRGGAWL